jgi:hypothetical protein
MQGNPNDKSRILIYGEIHQLLPHIEKFVLDLGNNFVNLEEKFSFIENNNVQLKNALGTEASKSKKLSESINDLKAENKFLK